MPPKLHLSIQYAIATPDLPRWRIRRWALRAVHMAAADQIAATDETFHSAELTIRLVDTTEMQELNRDYRQRDKATNVLTFEYGQDPDKTVRGDIVICVPVLEDEAREQGKPVLHHAAHLVVHGVFHALGYDHIDPSDAKHMEQLETTLLRALGIQDPYQI